MRCPITTSRSWSKSISTVPPEATSKPITNRPRSPHNPYPLGFLPFLSIPSRPFAWPFNLHPISRIYPSTDEVAYNISWGWKATWGCRWVWLFTAGIWWRPVGWMTRERVRPEEVEEVKGSDGSRGEGREWRVVVWERNEEWVIADVAAKTLVWLWTSNDARWSCRCHLWTDIEAFRESHRWTSPSMLAVTKAFSSPFW